MSNTVITIHVIAMSLMLGILFSDSVKLVNGTVVYAITWFAVYYLSVTFYGAVKDGVRRFLK